MKILIVNDKTDKVFNLTEFLPEVLEDGNATFQQAIDFFMLSLDGDRYGVFTDSITMLDWVVNGEGNFIEREGFDQ